MKLAFCLFHYFPFGGLQRDFFRIALSCQARGHEVHVFTMSWQGDVPEGFYVHHIQVKGWTNHGKAFRFSCQISSILSESDYDVVIGFNKMAGLDLYYAADPCFLSKAASKHRFWSRFGRRYRTFSRLEEEVFSVASSTRILLISEVEKPNFISCYGTPEDRFFSLPPGIDRDRLPSENYQVIRQTVRAELGLETDNRLVLMVGSSFATKGVDRAIRAMAALPVDLQKITKLVVVGQGAHQSYLRLAGKLGVRDRVRFLGPRDDVPRFLWAADLLLHPSRYENTGTVIVEALAAGLPVLATAVCGYGFHVIDAGAGLLVPEPFSQGRMNSLLHEALISSMRFQWKKNTLAYAESTDLFSLHTRVADIIEEIGK
ncbi:glycosyltransferase family 1 protein [bacterium]|nr:glycosyltransferase family 1 protein [bacterium]